jgi:2-C-methyl-D-erythritol 4-phosphate cytidylyltransferase
MNIAVIVAAGTGTRFGGDIPKQFTEVAGKPVIAHTVRRFEESDMIGGIVVVTSADRLAEMRSIIAAEGFEKVLEVVEGGASRAESVACGVEAACANHCEVLLIHDGARPLVSASEIDATAAAALRDGAACLVAPVTDTVKEVAFGKVVRTIDRTTLRRALTPQAFRPDILRQAMLSTDLDASVTDEAMLVEQAGFTVVTVEGSAANIKITLPEDLILAEALLGGL